jgi:hypothetical protein
MIPDALMRNMSDEELARAIYCAADMPPIAAELARRLVAAADASTAAEDEPRVAEAAPEYDCPYCDGEYD